MKRQAIFMIFLILTIPIYSASAFEAYNVSVSAYGNDGVDNVIKKKDTLSIKVTTDAPIPANDPKYVKFDQSGRISQFDTCAQEGTKMVCRYEETGSYTGGRYNFIIHIKNQLQTRDVASQNSYYVVADAKPSITISEPREEKNEFILDYSAESKPCTGLKKIELYVDNVLKKEIKINNSECTGIGSISLAKSSLGQGLKKACAYSKDVVDISSNPACKDMMIDTRSGSIVQAFLTDDSGEKLSYFSNWEAQYTFVVNLTDEGTGFSKNNVYANLSSIYPGAGYDVEQLACEKDGEKNWLCKKQVLVKTESSRSASVKINATDDAGNAAVTTKTLSLSYVNAEPSIDYMKTDHINPISGASFLGKENYISFKLTSQATISDVTVKARYEDQGIVQEPQELDGDCTGTTNLECAYEFTLSENALPKNAEITVTGNNIIGGLTKTESFDTDFENPKFKEAFIMGLPGKDYLSSGDSVTFLLNLTDSSSGVDAHRAAATFSFGDYTRTLACTPYENYAECTYPLNDIIAGEIGINGTFYDNAGNQESFAISNVTYLYSTDSGFERKQDYTTIYQMVDSSAEDLWKIDVASTSPSRIDRQLAQMGVPGMTITVYSVLNYVPVPGKNQVVYSARLESCNATYFDVSDASLFSAGSEQILALPLYPDGMKGVNSIRATCIVSTVSKLNEKDMTLPEYDNITITVPVYNSPLGEMDQNVQQEIGNVEKTINSSLYQFVAKAQKFMDSTKKICAIITTYYSMVTLYSITSDIFAMVVKTTPPPIDAAPAATQSIIDKAGGLLDVTSSQFFKYAHKFCLYASCNLALTEIWNKDNDNGPKNTAGVAASAWVNVCGAYNSPAGEGAQEAASRELNNYVDTLDGKTGSSQGPSTSDTEKFMTLWLQSASIKDSLIFSMACLCLPGVIYNLNKYRQIECMYLQCLKSTAYGTPKYICDQTRDYMNCKYVYGEIFRLIPGAPIANLIMGQIKAAFNNVATLLTTALEITCSPWGIKWLMPGKVSPPAHKMACLINKWLDKITQVSCSLGITNGCIAAWRESSDTLGDYCEVGE